jgi:O-antigen/teichoic acid export membrane protein
MVSSTACINIYNYLSLRQEFSLRLSLEKITHHITSMKSIFASRVCVAGYTSLDVIILGFFTSPQYVGFYSVCSRLVRSVAGVLSSATLVSFGSNARARAQGPSLGGSLNTELFMLLNILAFPVIIFIAVYASEIIQILLGSQFNPSTDALILMSPIIYLGVVGSFSGMNILYANKKDGAVLSALALGAVASVSVNFYLAPVLHHVGSAIAALMAEITIVGFQLYKIKKLKLEFISVNFHRAARLGIVFFIYTLIVLALNFRLTNNNSIINVFADGIIIGTAYLVMLVIIREFEIVKFVKRFYR